jgi:hypothetical protein
VVIKCARAVFLKESLGKISSVMEEVVDLLETSQSSTSSLDPHSTIGQGVLFAAHFAPQRTRTTCSYLLIF